MRRRGGSAARGISRESALSLRDRQRRVTPVRNTDQLKGYSSSPSRGALASSMRGNKQPRWTVPTHPVCAILRLAAASVQRQSREEESGTTHAYPVEGGVRTRPYGQPPRVQICSAAASSPTAPPARQPRRCVARQEDSFHPACCGHRLFGVQSRLRRRIGKAYRSHCQGVVERAQTPQTGQPRVRVHTSIASFSQGLFCEE